MERGPFTIAHRSPDPPRAGARAVTLTGMPDRHADAVRARRHELRAQRALLTPGRTALRDALAAARATALARATADLAEVRRELDRAARPAAAVADAARAVETAAYRRFTDLAVAAERGTAADRGVALPVPPDDPPPPAAPDPPAPRRTGTWETLADAGTWRPAVLPLAAAPLTGFAGPSVALPAAGAAVLVLVAVVRSRRAAADRARLRRWSLALLADTRTRVDAELARRAVARAAAGAVRLDAALAGHRSAVDAELAAFGPREAVGA
ncbi:hypothetical protein PHY01_37690 [Pseudonocardia hydrocarbonoxydans]|uniref:Uncharacterized protein n=2 Tax=Pseudonocardia hydrocarbonoxydans TaxID=76726 RepID=A0A4Y3WVT5_9PSEU|nr:hypothetical protein PHY01_37690 [Pseudonocardia hydrocarbonoxydans]